MIFSLIMLVFSGREIQVGKITFGLVGPHALAPYFALQEATDNEGVIANHLRIEAESPLPREPYIVRVALEHLGRGIGRLPVGAGKNQLAEKVFDIPSVFHEIDREVIQ